MTRWIEHAAVVPAGLAGVLLFMQLLRLRTPARAALCRGPDRRWLHSFLPWHWFYSRRCDYDLSGSIPDAAGRVICPECGTRQTPSARRRRPTRWHTERIAVVLLLVALACWKVRWIRDGGWVPYAPTPMLLAIEHAAPSIAPCDIRPELSDRASDMARVWKPWLCHIAINELCDDHVRSNAGWAADLLIDLVPTSIAPLEHALDSREYQRRQVAAMILERLIDGDHWRSINLPDLPPRYAPPRRLFEVAVEGLASDRIRWDSGIFDSNHAAAFRFLVRHAPQATRELEAAIESSDPQQRLLASAIVAISRLPTLAERGAKNLLESLADDSQEDNALFAFQALRRMGDAAIPILEASIAAEPDQQSQRARAALLLVYRLRGTPITSAESRRLNSLSTANDPDHAGESWLLRMMPPLAEGRE